MLMKDIEIKNPDMIELLDKLAQEVDRIFEFKVNDEHLLSICKKERYEHINPYIRMEQGKNDPWITAPHWDILPWNVNDEFKENEMHPCGREYLEHMKKEMVRLGNHDRSTEGFPNKESFVGAKELLLKPEFNEEFPQFNTLTKEVCFRFFGGNSQALCAFYSPGDFIPWHHNGNAPGYNILLHYNKEGNGSFYTHHEGEIIEFPDKKGWVCRAGQFFDTWSDGKFKKMRRYTKGVDTTNLYTTQLCADEESASWHCAQTQSNRFTLSTICNHEEIWLDLIDEIEDN